MKDNITQDMRMKDNQLIIDYIYGELNREQRDTFERRLATDQHFKSLVLRQQKLNQLIEPGVSPDISEQRASAVDWALHKKLSYAANNKQQGSKYSTLFQRKVALKTQLLGMALTFILGFLLAQSPLFFTPDAEPATEFVIANQAPPLALVGDDDYQIVDLELVNHDLKSGVVKLNYSLNASTKLSAELASENVLALLAQTIKNDVSDQTRLEIVEIFRNYAQTSQVSQALSYSLLNDPNPGVRIAAAESLSELSNDKTVRHTLRQALENDTNAGIRVVAFEGLIKHLDDIATINTLKHSSLNDSNTYIRRQARLLLGSNTTTNNKI